MNIYPAFLNIPKAPFLLLQPDRKIFAGYERSESQVSDIYDWEWSVEERNYGGMNIYPAFLNIPKAPFLLLQPYWLLSGCSNASFLDAIMPDT